MPSLQAASWSGSGNSEFKTTLNVSWSFGLRGDKFPAYRNPVKKIRLDKDSYFQDGYPCHITICSSNGADIFIKDKFTVACMNLLESLCNECEIAPLVYCFMPDHVHMVISVAGHKSIVAFVQAFKSKATLESYRHDFEGRIFQTRFYDRFIRTYESLENEIRYVLENPVRNGLVKDSAEYRYSKCFLE